MAFISASDLWIPTPQGPGIVMNAEAGGTFLGNEVLANFGPGVTISGTSQPTMEGNKINLNQQAGVMCWGEACPDLSANTIQENGEAGMVIGENVTATIMQVSIGIGVATQVPSTDRAVS